MITNHWLPTNEQVYAAYSQSDVIIVSHHFAPEEIRLVQFIDQDIELLDALVHLQWVDRFSSTSELCQFLRDMRKAFTEYPGIQIEVEAAYDYIRQVHRAIDHQRNVVALNLWGERFSVEIFEGL